MRGFPFLNLLLALLVSGAVVWPLVWRSTQVPAAPAAAREAEIAPAPGRVASFVSLRFVHAPVRVVMKTGESVLHEWPAPGGLLLEDTVSVPLSDDRTEFSLQIEWPAGTPDTVAELKVEPEGRESRSTNVWGREGKADELITLNWKP